MFFLTRKWLPHSRTHHLLPVLTSSEVLWGEASMSTVDLLSSKPQWVPLMFRWYLISIPIILSLAIGLTSIFLYWRSNESNGLSSEASAIFGWKFIPTLVAVIYTRTIGMLFEDVQRTEPFARLARQSSNVPEATFTLLERPKEWWIVLINGLRKKRNGGERSWVIVLCCLVYILASLIISPLSAALLSIKLVQSNIAVPMARIIPNNNSISDFHIDRGTFLRTTAALLQNYSSSPWVTDDFFILPFGPSKLGLPNWNARYAKPQSWIADTYVFQADLSCSKLELEKSDRYLRPPTQDEQEFLSKLPDGPSGKDFQYYLASIQMRTNDHCTYNLTFNANQFSMYPDIARYGKGLGSWTTIDKFAMADGFSSDARILFTDGCQGDESIILSTPWCPPSQATCQTFPANHSATGYICSSKYRIAEIPVRVSLTETSFAIDFDKEKFRIVSDEHPSITLNVSQLHDQLLTPEWFRYLTQPGAPVTSWPVPPFNGLAALLSSQYSNNLTTMMSDSNILLQASRIRRRFFAEVLQSTLNTAGSSTIETTSGTELVPEHRVTVSEQVAYVICSLALASFLMLISTAWMLQMGHRPLNSFHNTSTVSGILSLVATNEAVLLKFKELNRRSKKVMKMALKGDVYATTPGVLLTLCKEPKSSFLDDHDDELLNESRNLIRRRRTFLGLLIFLIFLMVALTVLHDYDDGFGLYASIFTYRVDLGGTQTLGSFSPFSLVPTICAVILALWWEAIDKSFRSFQPFVAMSQKPRKISRALNLSYSPSIWLLDTMKAAYNKHWILALVTFGSFLTQILTVDMSTLFRQTNGITLRQIEFSRPLELRRFPLVVPVGKWYTENSSMPSFDPMFAHEIESVLDSALSPLNTSWLYTATIQGLFNALEPPWSKDGWSFLPFTLSSLPNVVKLHGSNDSLVDDIWRLYPGSNFTYDTPALRARIDCTMIPDIDNISQWLSFAEPTGSLDWNASDKDTPLYIPDITMFPDSDHWTSMLPQIASPICCTNHSNMSLGSNGERSVLAIGHWTVNYPRDSHKNPTIFQTTGNFTVKWIRGLADIEEVKDLVGPSTYHMYFPTSPPAIQALNCMPVIESASAAVTVESESGHVQGYEILSIDGVEDVAWSDDFVLRQPSEHVEFGNQSKPVQVMHNMTTSYGFLFLNALLRASHKGLQSQAQHISLTKNLLQENIDDQVYNVRDKRMGLNTDFMSYLSYERAGQDTPTALLDEQTLREHSQKTFSLFFQHFVSNGLSLEKGGWAYQPFGSSLEAQPPVDEFSFTNRGKNVTPPPYRSYLPNGSYAPRFEDVFAHNLSRYAEGKLSTRIDMLKFNQVAFWLAISILSWLLITVLILVIRQKQHVGGIRRNIDCIADVLVLIASSERLLALVREKGMDALIKEDKVCTKLGYFENTDGKTRWGIEVVDIGDVWQEQNIRAGSQVYTSVPE